MAGSSWGGKVPLLPSLANFAHKAGFWSGFLLCCFSPFGWAYAMRAGGFVAQGFCVMGDTRALVFTEGAKYLASDF